MNEKTWTVLNKFKKSNIRFGLIPLESTSTLPIPLKIRGTIYLALLFYTGRRLKKEEKVKVFRPNCKVVIDYSTGKVVSYQDWYSLNKNVAWNEPIGEFPHKEIKKMTVKEYNEQNNELLVKYDKAIDLFLNNKDDAGFKNDFRNQLYHLCAPCLLPYMNNVGKDFFNWLRLDENSVEQES